LSGSGKFSTRSATSVKIGAAARFPSDAWQARKIFEFCACHWRAVFGKTLEMVADFTLDFVVGLSFGLFVFFVVYGSAVMFRAFKIPGDGG
jgi:hypothetical protein